MKRFRTYQKRERYWRRLLEEWKISDQTIQVFCEARQIAASSFYTWRRRLCYTKSPKPIVQPINESLAFVPVTVELPQENLKTLKFCLPNGCWLILEQDFDVTLLKRLLKIMEVNHVHVT